MYTQLTYILPSTAYHLTLPTLTTLLPFPPQTLFLYLLLYHVPYTIFIYTSFHRHGPPITVLLPLSLILLLLSHAFSTKFPLIPAFPLLSFSRAQATSHIANLPVHRLARVDLVSTLLSAVASLLVLIPGAVIPAYIVLLLISFVPLYQQYRSENSAYHQIGEDTLLLKPVITASNDYGLRLLLPLTLTAFSTACIHHSYPRLCQPSRPVLLAFLCLTSLSEPVFQRLPITQSQIIGAVLSLSGSVLVMTGWTGAGVLLLGCGGAAVGVCAMKHVIENNSAMELGDVILITGITFAIGEAIGVLVGGISPEGRVWALVSVAILTILLVCELIRVAREWGNVIYGFVGMDIQRNANEIDDRT